MDNKNLIGWVVSLAVTAVVVYYIAQAAGKGWTKGTE